MYDTYKRENCPFNIKEKFPFIAENEFFLCKGGNVPDIAGKFPGSKRHFNSVMYTQSHCLHYIFRSVSVVI